MEHQKLKLSLDDLRIESFDTAPLPEGPTAVHALSDGCTDCSNCSGCSNCSNCSNCTACSNCSNCSNCTWDTNCAGCTYMTCTNGTYCAFWTDLRGPY